ncbi:hypothetical protein IEQ44_07605 [Nocardioides sp. Y6]|uniref:ARG and Rhodanese-Phosphatase-superfamily-associated domain-containing protein n=1 Tax=Nocardioides malaquae TaxID=2773426 RepID=A0ABR9RSG7_9ACTN|nr:DUF6569 family protein [Nocardioides malaquae]MBE7324514.1 hypothetical protein [Nocardioides malaquae]
MIENIHVGRGLTRGSMTVFPLWAPRTGPSTHTVSPRTLDVAETDGGPQVDTLVMGNHGDKAVLVLEGQLFEGGWQHRMATRPVMIGIHQQVPVEVACVEQGRWEGERTQRWPPCHAVGARVGAEPLRRRPACPGRPAS